MMAEGGSTGEKQHEHYDEGSVEVKDDIENEINIPFDNIAAPDDQDDIKVLKPIAQLPNFFKKDKTKTIIDMKWVLNDTFLVIITSDNEIIFFDVLLKVFSFQSKFSDIQENRLVQCINDKPLRGPKVDDR